MGEGNIQIKKNLYIEYIVCGLQNSFLLNDHW